MKNNYDNQLVIKQEYTEGKQRKGLFYDYGSEGFRFES